MAYLDVKEHFLQVENQYLDMCKYVKQLENTQGISKENIEVMKTNVEILKANYERLAYVMYLFNKPKSIKKRKSIKQDDEQIFINLGVDKQTIINENTNVLTYFKQYLKDKEN